MHRSDRGPAADEDEARAIGRGTLSETLRPGTQLDGPPNRPLFDDDVAWEDLDGDRHLMQAPPANAAPVVPVDDPKALETIYSDDRKKGDFQRKRKAGEQPHVRTGKYNKRAVKSDKTTGQVAGRPGVVVTNKGHEDGTFMLKNATATRYLFINRGGQNIAQPFDIIEKAKLSDHNYRAKGKKADKDGHTQRILLNPSQPRTLVIDNKPEVCVLSWIDGQTAAWIPVAQLAGDTSKILAAVRARAKRWNPGRVSNKPGEILQHSRRYVLRNDDVARPTKADDGDVLAAGKTSGDNVTHYLGKDIRKEGFGAGGVPLGANVTRSVVPICMNLPVGHTPPVAIDTAQAGESFFVMNDKRFHQEVPVFESGQRTSKILMKWVFGHLGMYDATGALVPDPARRGWVPARTLADAAKLVTTQIPQRH